MSKYYVKAIEYRKYLSPEDDLPVVYKGENEIIVSGKNFHSFLENLKQYMKENKMKVESLDQDYFLIATEGEVIECSISVLSPSEAAKIKSLNY